MTALRIVKALSWTATAIAHPALIIVALNASKGSIVDQTMTTVVLSAFGCGIIAWLNHSIQTELTKRICEREPRKPVSDTLLLGRPARHVKPLPVINAEFSEVSA